MRLADLRRFAQDLRLAHIDAVVVQGQAMHLLSINGVDFFFYHHAWPRPDQPDWPTQDIQEYDGWGSGRPDIVQKEGT